MIKHDIQIVIVDDSRGEKCEAGGGVDWSSDEAITLANQRIKDLPLPLLVINGEPRISGQFDIRRLLDAIETEVEIKL